MQREQWLRPQRQDQEGADAWVDCGGRVRSFGSVSKLSQSNLFQLWFVALGRLVLVGTKLTSLARNGRLLLERNDKKRDAYMLSRTIPRVKIVTARA